VYSYARNPDARDSFLLKMDPKDYFLPYHAQIQQVPSYSALS